MQNSPLLSLAISARPNTSLGRLMREIPDNRDLLVELYLKVLAREPSSEETRTCLSHVRATSSRGEAFEDILWVLINSTEFLHRK